MDRQREKFLIAQAKKNIEAFEELYDWYLPRIFGYILNRVGHREEAEDLTSQTFAKVLANLPRYEERGISFGAWVYRIATNTIIDRSRKKKEYIMDPDIIRECVSGEKITSPEEDMMLMQNSEALRSCLSHLKAEHQSVLALKFFEELDNGEIAEIIGCRPGTVAVKVHRALKALKKEVDRLNLLKKTNYV